MSCNAAVAGDFGIAYLHSLHTTNKSCGSFKLCKVHGPRKRANSTTSKSAPSSRKTCKVFKFGSRPFSLFHPYFFLIIFQVQFVRRERGQVASHQGQLPQERVLPRELPLHAEGRQRSEGCFARSRWILSPRRPREERKE